MRPRPALPTRWWAQTAVPAKMTPEAAIPAGTHVKGPVIQDRKVRNFMYGRERSGPEQLADEKIHDSLRIGP